MPKTVSPKTVSERLDLSFGIFARRGEKYSCYAAVPQLSANSGETIRRLCLEGNGIACLSDFTVAADIAAGHLHELLPNRALNEAKPFYAVYLLRRQCRQPKNPGVCGFFGGTAGGKAGWGDLKT